ncbi:hypothetical protein PV326_011626 [Microctonus aethiopoides]|nr:hypothetical protein PV326_011626 [Microctonus aethiopoides]
MSPASLAVCFGPVLMLHAEDTGPNLDFHQPIAVLKYLLEIWPVKSAGKLSQTVRKISTVGSTLPRVTPTVGLTSSTSSSNIISNHHPSHHQLQHQHHHHQQQQQQQQQQPQQHQMSHQGTLTRTALPWQQPPSLHHPPLTSAPGAYVPSIRPPPPVKPRQVIISSPGSPSSEESASPEPINKTMRNGLNFTNGTTKLMTTTTTAMTTTTMMRGTNSIEQITPTSSVDTEEGNPPHLEERERGVEGDVEASDDDLISKRNKS